MRLSTYFAAIASLAALATSAPTRKRDASSPDLATVTLRLTGSQNTHYAATNQSPTNDQAQHLTIVVGQTLSLENDPLHIQGLQIDGIKAGKSLSLRSSTVDENDSRVSCSAQVDGRDGPFEFELQDKGVLLAGGRLARVRSLSCGMAGEVAR
jgi:hypothetical protein